MSVLIGPRPGVGQQSHVIINSVPLELLPDTYNVTEAPRFGDKISTGAIKYADFNPYESAQAVDSFIGGYGVRRYADLPRPIDQDISEQQVYLEATNIDCGYGPAFLGPELTTESLTGIITPIVWLGEFTPNGGALVGLTKWVAVAGKKIWYRETNGTWTDTTLVLNQNAVQNAVGTFNGNLILGYGAAGTAQYTNDLATLGNVTNTTPANLFVFAFTADRAATYIAGGTAATMTNNVLSSTNGITTYPLVASAIVCGSTEEPIVSLAPGGGIYQVIVGKTTELGMIDSVPNYHSLVPYDSRLSQNSRPLQWWLAGGGDAQRGPVQLVFRRDRAIWTYTPSNQTPGTAANISPWGQPGFRPPNIIGAPGAFQGTARWLYAAITNGTTSNTYILKHDALTGNWHSLIDLGVNVCTAMGVTSLFGTNPLMFVGRGNGIARFTLPLDGDDPRDNSGCTFATSGVLTMPDMDLGFPDEQKIALSVIVVTDSVSAGAQTVSVEFRVDGGTWTTLGSVTSSPSQKLDFPSQTSGRRIGLRFTLGTNTNTLTPQLLGFSMRVSLNPLLYRIWSFTTYLPTGYYANMTEALQNPKTLIDDFWTTRKAGFPVAFQDRWQDTYTVRILELKEAEAKREPDATPETLMEFRLLEVAVGAGSIVFDDALAIFDASGVRFGSP